VTFVQWGRSDKLGNEALVTVAALAADTPRKRVLIEGFMERKK